MVSRKLLSRIGTATAVLLVLVGLAVPLGAGAGDGEPNEPNDAQGAATEITGDSIQGEISVSGGTDWFAKEYSKGDEISIVITKKLKDYGLKMSLHAPNGTELDNATARQGVDIAQLTAKAPRSGEYGVEVQGLNDDRKGMGYTVHTSYTGEIKVTDTKFRNGTVHEKEPNNDNPNATYINKSHIRGEMSDIGDDTDDKFAIQVRKGEKISILVEMDNPEHRIFFFPKEPADRDGERHRADEEEEIDHGDKRGQIVKQAKRNGTFIVTLYGTQEVGLKDLPHTYSIHIKSLGIHPLPSEESTSTPQETSTTETSAKSTEIDQQTKSNDQSSADSSQNETATESDATKLFGPGFTAPAAILAIVLAGLFGWRRS